MSVVKEITHDIANNQLVVYDTNGGVNYVGLGTVPTLSPYPTFNFDSVNQQLMITRENGAVEYVYLGSHGTSKENDLVTAAKDCLNDLKFGPRLAAQIAGHDWVEVGVTLEAYKLARAGDDL